MTWLYKLSRPKNTYTWESKVAMCYIAFDGNAIFTSLALRFMESLFGLVHHIYAKQKYGKLIIHERHAATPVCSSISLSYQALHDLAIQTFTSYKYLHLGELKISSSLGTNNSASLPLMEESSLTSTLCTSRARTGAPRQDSAAMVNWISLLFNQ